MIDKNQIKDTLGEMIANQWLKTNESLVLKALNLPQTTKILHVLAEPQKEPAANELNDVVAPELKREYGFDFIFGKQVGFVFEIQFAIDARAWDCPYFDNYGHLRLRMMKSKTKLLHKFTRAKNSKGLQQPRLTGDSLPAIHYNLQKQLYNSFAHGYLFVDIHKRSIIGEDYSPAPIIKTADYLGALKSGFVSGKAYAPWKHEHFVLDNMHNIFHDIGQYRIFPDVKAFFTGLKQYKKSHWNIRILVENTQYEVIDKKFKIRTGTARFLVVYDESGNEKYKLPIEYASKNK